MSLHYLDPEREPRECDFCNGTGRLGVEGAEPDVEIRYSKQYPAGWQWSIRFQGARLWSKPYPTKAAALEAARRAHREGTS